MISIDVLVSSVDPAGVRQVFGEAARRYARLATLDVDEWWSAQIREALVASLDAFAGNEAPTDVRAMVALMSRVEEALDLLDETPTGARYYPYEALVRLSTSLSGLIGDQPAKMLGHLAEYAHRYANHADWQLRKSRIPVLEGRTFEVLENDLWLRSARLTGARDAGFAAYRAASDALTDRYRAFIQAAFSPNSSADYIVTAEADAVAHLGPSGTWTHQDGTDVRYSTTGPPLEVAEASPIGSVNLRAVETMYLWSDSPTAVAHFVAEHVAAPAWIDPRGSDGAAYERDAFIEHPVPTGAPW